MSLYLFNVLHINYDSCTYISYKTYFSVIKMCPSYMTYKINYFLF